MSWALMIEPFALWLDDVAEITSLASLAESKFRRSSSRGRDLNSRCDIQSPENSAYFFGCWHSKFAASFRLPLPLYFPACGYGHRGRVIFACAGSWSSNFDAIMIDGAVAFSTHCSKDASTLCCGSSNFRS